MEQFIHRENLVIFRRRLADAGTTDAQRQVLLKLLADEEARNGPLPADTVLDESEPRRPK